MTTAETYGFIKPTDTDYIKDGDDAISHNADVAANLISFVEELASLPGSRRENSVLDPKPVNAPATYTPSRCSIVQAPGYGRMTCNSSGATNVAAHLTLSSDAVMKQRQEVTPGQTFLARVDMRGVPEQDMGGQLVITGYSLAAGSWTIIGSVAQTAVTLLPAGTSVVTLEVTGTVPSGVTHLDLKIMFRRWGQSYPEIGDLVFWRRAQLTIGADLTADNTPYFDGDSYASRWAGEPNNSHSITAESAATISAESVAALAGIAHPTMLNEWSHREGGKQRIGNTTSLSVRIDHGLGKFATSLRPILEANGIPYTIALGADTWNLPENAGISAADVNSWVQGGLCKIASHGWGNHLDTSDPATIHKYIVDSKTRLEADIPAAAPIDIYMPHGGSGQGQYGGFKPVDSPAKFFNTYAGQVALLTYPICTGNFPDTAYRIQDGVPRVGQAYFNMDTFTASGVMIRVNQAIAEGRGIQLMIHPNLIDTAGYITTAELTDLFNQLKTLHDAGTIKFMSVAQQYLADSTTP